MPQDLGHIAEYCGLHGVSMVKKNTKKHPWHYNRNLDMDHGTFHQADQAAGHTLDWDSGWKPCLRRVWQNIRNLTDRRHCAKAFWIRYCRNSLMRVRKLNSVDSQIHWLSARRSRGVDVVIMRLVLRSNVWSV